MKRLLLFLLLLTSYSFSFAQFADTTALANYIRDTIKDRRPEKVTAAQIQKAMLGTKSLLKTSPVNVYTSDGILSGHRTINTFNRSFTVTGSGNITLQNAGDLFYDNYINISNSMIRNFAQSVMSGNYSDVRFRSDSIEFTNSLGNYKFYNLPAGTTADQLLTISSGNFLRKLPTSSFEVPLTFSNGLKRTSNTVTWEGDLTKNTTLNGKGIYGLVADSMSDLSLTAVFHDNFTGNDYVSNLVLDGNSGNGWVTGGPTGLSWLSMNQSNASLSALNATQDTLTSLVMNEDSLYLQNENNILKLTRSGTTNSIFFPDAYSTPGDTIFTNQFNGYNPAADSYETTVNNSYHTGGVLNDSTTVNTNPWGFNVSAQQNITGSQINNTINAGSYYARIATVSNNPSGPLSHHSDISSTQNESRMNVYNAISNRKAEVDVYNPDIAGAQRVLISLEDEVSNNNLYVGRDSSYTDKEIILRGGATVRNSLKTDALFGNYVTVSASSNYTVTGSDYFIELPFITGSDKTINLPNPASCKGRILIIINNNNGLVNWNANYNLSRVGGLTLIGPLQTKTYNLVSTGSVWFITALDE